MQTSALQTIEGYMMVVGRKYNTFWDTRLLTTPQRMGIASLGVIWADKDEGVR